MRARTCGAGRARGACAYLESRGETAGDSKSGRGLTIGVLRAGQAGAEVRIVVAHAAEHAVAHALVHADRDAVRAAHEEVDEEAAVRRVGRALEARAERARDREAAVLGRDGHGGDVPVPVGVVALCFADDCVFGREGGRDAR